MAGIFAYAGGTWHLAGPALPASYARQRVTVLRLTTTAGTTMALLAAGTGPGARLLAAWSTGDSGAHWALSPPLPLRGTKLTSASSGPGGTVAVVLTGNHAQTITGPAGAWRPLPALPPGTATLAPGPAWRMGRPRRPQHQAHRLAAHARHAAWAATQTISVPIQFGSSG